MNRTNIFTIAVAVAAALIPACATDSSTSTPGSDELAGENGQDGESAKADAAHDEFGFMAVKKDGAFNCNTLNCTTYSLTRVNRTTVLCIDGQYHASCTVKGVDFSALSQATQTKVTDALQREAADPTIGTHVLVKGAFKNNVDFVTFQATEVWLAQRQVGSTDGTFVRIFDNGVRCITAPCPTLTEERVNSNRSSGIEGLDFGITAKNTLEDAFERGLYAATSTADGLILAGNRTTQPSGASSEKLRTVDQAFLRVH